jgi:hypothetical protein
VPGIVHHVEEDPGGGSVGEVLDQGPTPLVSGSTLGRERLRFGHDLGGTTVGTHDPEPDVPRSVRSRLVPPDRGFAPQPGENFVREPVGEEIEISEVDFSGFDRHPVRMVTTASRRLPFDRE